MDKDIERLRVMLGDQDVWQNSRRDETIKGTGYPSSQHPDIYSSDPEDYEKILSYEHSVGGRLEDAICCGQGENIKIYIWGVADCLYFAVPELFDFPEYNLQIGQEAPEGESFCTLRALTRYPYDYISAAIRDGIIREFFAEGNLYERVWDFFYIYPPASISRKAILLVPSRQVQHFLITINISRESYLKLPDSAKETCLVFDFPKDGTPRPRYLGQANEHEMAALLKQSIPSASYRTECESETIQEPNEQLLLAYRKKIERLLEIQTKRKAGMKQKKKTERFAKQQAWNHSIKRVQRYLGIRENRCYPAQVLGPAGNAFNYSVSDSLTIGRADESKTSSAKISNVLDINKPAPFVQEDSVIFICVDVEAFERDHNIITEIGIATLDTADIIVTSPGKNGSNWMRAIRARHFRIKEFEHLENKDFLIGCAEHFNFGKSEWIGMKNAAHQISECFKPPYFKQETSLNMKENIRLDEQERGGKRNIILVGHDVMMDVKYLRKLGYDPYNLSNLRELVDTSCMCQALHRESSPRSLGNILADLNIPSWFLHNAGNDAVYTLQAMISIAIKAMLERTNTGPRQQENYERIAESVKAATNAAWEAQQGWSSDGSDGGAPEAPLHTGPLKSGSKEQVPGLDSA